MAVSTTTTAAVGEKFLAYDGDCPMCTSTIALLLRWGLVRPEQARSNHDLVDGELESVRAAGIRNQLVVLDPATGQTRVGSDGLLWIIGDNFRHPWWVQIWTWPGMRQLMRFGYEAISYNRRVISPPKHRIVCDCEPEVTFARRLALIIPAPFVTFASLGLFGMAVFAGGELGGVLWGAGYLKTTVFAAWSVLVVAACLRLPKEKALDYVAHLSITGLVGGLVLLPSALVVFLLPPTAALCVAAFAGVANYAVITAMQQRRIAAQALAPGWFWAFVALTAGAYGSYAFECYRLFYG